MYLVIALPNYSDVSSAITTYGNPLFQDLLPWVYMTIGLFVGAGFVVWIITYFRDKLDELLEKREQEISDTKEVKAWRNKQNSAFINWNKKQNKKERIEKLKKNEPVGGY